MFRLNELKSIKRETAYDFSTLRVISLNITTDDIMYFQDTSLAIDLQEDFDSAGSPSM